MKNNSLSLKSKFAYCGGDVGNNLIYQFASIYLLIFYTDVFGISAAQASTLFLVARVWDAINDPIMGVIADKTRTRFGRFRPYILLSGIPLAVISVAMVTVPDLSDGGKLAYAYVTYIGFGMAYTAINVPYLALISTLTSDGVERGKLIAMRSALVVLASLCMAAAPYLIEAFGGGDKALGYKVTMICFASISLILWFTCFKFSKETISPKENQIINPKTVFSYLKSNKPLMFLCSCFFGVFAVITMAGSAGIYIFTYLLDRPDMFPVMMVINIISMLVGIMVAKVLIGRFEKKNLLIFGILIMIMRASVFYFTKDVNIILAVTFLGGVGTGLMVALIWGFVPDTIEYGEHKTGLRIEGVTNAIIGFFFKFGSAIGGVVPGYVLSAYNYVPNVQQSEESLTGILHMATTVPILFLLVCAVIMFFYPLTEEKHSEIIAELNVSR